MKSRSPGNASAGTGLRVAILLGSLRPSDSDSRLLGDLLSVDYVNVAAISIGMGVARQVRSRTNMPFLMRFYRAVDQFANRSGSNANARRFESYARTLPAGAIIHFDDHRSLASELRARDLDVILCPSPFLGAERYADCARYGIWWIGPSPSLRPEMSYARHFFSIANTRAPLAEMIWAATTEQPTPFPIEFGSTPLVSGISVEKNFEPLETVRRSLWLAALRKPHLRALDALRAHGENLRAAADLTSAAAIQSHFEGSWPVARSLARMGLRQIRHRIQRRNQTELWRVGIRPTRDQGRAFCDTNGYQWLTAPSGHWYADPFVLCFHDKNVLFMEEYDEARKRGRIVCAELDSSCQVAGVQPVLQCPYHLAYPHVFEHGGEVFMIPDSGFNNTVELYHAVSFPWKWELVRILYSGPAFDTSVFPYEDKFWFFTSHVNDAGRHAAQLLLFHAASLDGEWSMHPASPISHDARFARGAGRIFTQSSQILRPAQDGSQTYGGAIHFRRIETLNDREYAESADASITPAGISNAVGLHTYNRSALMEVIDCRIKRKPGV